jgi:hypothetical protein
MTMAGYFSAATFRTIGSAATPQVLFTIENIDSTKLVYIRRLVIQMDATAVLTAVMPLAKTARATGVPTGGTTLNKALFDTANSSNLNTIVRGACSSDGGALSAPSATPGNTIWQQYGFRMHTAVGQIIGIDSNLLPALVDTQNFILRQDEAIVVSIIAAAGTSNPATNHYIVGVVWEEN